MASVTLGTMLTQALREADAEGHLDMAVAADRLRVVDYVNAGLEELHNLQTEAFEDYRVTRSGAITIAAGASSVATGLTTLLKVRFVEHWSSGVVDTGDPTDVEPIAMAERNRYAGPRAYFFGDAGTLYVRPVSEAPGVYSIWYTPEFTLLVADGDTFVAPSGWHRLAVLEAAIRLKGDMEKDASRLVDRKGKLEAKIKGLATRRISGRPAKVRRVRKTLLEKVREIDDPTREIVP